MYYPLALPASFFGSDWWAIHQAINYLTVIIIITFSYFWI